MVDDELPAVELELGAAGLSAGGVTEGAGGLVSVDEILASSLGRELAPGLSGLALVLKIVSSLSGNKRVWLRESVFLTQITLPGQVIIGGGATRESTMKNISHLIYQHHHHHHHTCSH